MLRRSLLIMMLLGMTCFSAKQGLAAPFEVTNVIVSVQAEDAVKARDQAIAKAQRHAFGALVGVNGTDLQAVTDAQIARLVRGFSLHGERVASRSYAANFSIRFNPAATQNFILSNGLRLTEQAARGETIVVSKPVTATVPAADGKAAEETAPATETVAIAKPVLVLPVLDIGSRRVIWDDPNPWRDIWQEKDQSVPSLSVRVPLGDVSDITDIPDAGFLSGNSAANIPSILQHYAASDLYVVIAKNLGASLNPEGGMSISLYRHDGQKLSFIRKKVIHPRPGYLFNDAVPAAIQMIALAQINHSPETSSASSVETVTEELPVASAATPSISGGQLVVTIPYQSLQQWVGIQRRLRLVPGVKSIIPIRLSPSSAQVRILTTTSSSEDFTRNLAMQRFEIQQMPNNEMALIEQQ
jgi:hypothetical protein